MKANTKCAVCGMSDMPLDASGRDAVCARSSDDLKAACADVRWEAMQANTEHGFTLRQRNEMSRAFDSGNFANAYESTDLESFARKLEGWPEHMRAAFVLGFFGSYTLDEIGSDREIFDECYWSKAGQYVIKVARYCDDRTDDYRKESENF